MSLLLVVGLLAGGGLATSFAEYKFQYNLFDYVVEGYKKVFGFLTKEQIAYMTMERYIRDEVMRRFALLQADVKAAEKKL